MKNIQKILYNRYELNNNNVNAKVQ